MTYKYILNKINKYHQEIEVDDRYWTYLKADEVQEELDDLEEVLEKIAYHSIWWREEMSWEDLIKELGAEGYWGGIALRNWKTIW